MPKILVITHDSERHFYFANKICDEFDHTMVILGAKTINKSIAAKVRDKFKYPLSNIRNFALNFVFSQYRKRLFTEKDEIESLYFEGEKKHFYANHKDKILSHIDHRHYSVNDQSIVSKIRLAKPDFIVVMGSCLVSRSLIESAKYV